VARIARHEREHGRERGQRQRDRSRRLLREAVAPRLTGARGTRHR
jgi:hypothetical protein